MTTWTVPAVVAKVYDGDTVHVTLDLGWRISYAARVRLVSINCPEMKTAEGKAARDHAAELLPPGTAITVTSKALDQYGRVLGDIRLPDGRDYATVMVEAGQAIPTRY